jgi:hypothetical protein
MATHHVMVRVLLWPVLRLYLGARVLLKI